VYAPAQNRPPGHVVSSEGIEPPLMQPTHSAPSTAREATHAALDVRQDGDDEGMLVTEANVGESGLESYQAKQGRPSTRLAPLRIEELLLAERRKDEFLAMLSHELRNPLASIRNALGVLRTQGDTDVVVQHKMHALIDRQVRHMARLAAGLMDVSRISSGQLHLLRERIDLCIVVANAIETLEPELKLRHQRLKATWPDSPVWLQADPSRLEQVFVNLIANASKYTDEGGDLAVWMHTLGGHAVVRVRDSGIGIARETLPHIFNLFVQADATSPRSRSGLGIGLSLVRTLVELHGGSVIASSAGLGQGSEFTVRLPEDK
jgi:two-component system, sensor histidine kinase